jgi:hypothetical protein
MRDSTHTHTHIYVELCTNTSNHLQLRPRPINTIPLLIKENLPPLPQTRLQRNPNPNHLTATADINGDLAPLEHRPGKRLRLRHKRVLKALVVVLRDTALDARAGMRFKQVGSRGAVDGQFALCADD